jgi:heat shock protein HslJ
MTGRIALLLALTLGACASPGVDGPSLDGTTWRAVSIAGAPPFQGRAPTLRFEHGGVAGNAGCNGYGSTKATILGRSIRIENLGMTAALCAEDGAPLTLLMDLETIFVRTLGTADTIELDAGRLVISAGSAALVFEQTGPAQPVR